MQLFTIGVNRLNIDGTPVVDSNGDEVLNYNNDDITSFARVWTGFTAQTSRSNFEDNGGNKIDPMRINPTWRDRFVKTNLQNGFIGMLKSSFLVFPCFESYSTSLTVRRQIN
jgi:hypothetical protein